MKKKVKLMFAEHAWKQILWLTNHYDNEIGALGTVEVDEEKDGERYFIVTKLFFPKQEVTGATVNIASDGYSELIKEATTEELETMRFYWHRHPGCANHSHTDEKDTFGTFMDVKDKRKFFIFMQTANKGGELDIEPRIEFNRPVRLVIEKEDIEVMYEGPPEDEELAKEMKAIIEDRVIVKKWVNTYNNGTNNNRKFFGTIPFVGEFTVDEYKEFFPNCNDTLTYIDNDSVKEVFTKDEEKVSISCVSGQFTLTVGDLFRKVLESGLSEKGILKDVCRQHTMKDTKTLYIFKLQPALNKYVELKEKLFELFVSFNKIIYGNATGEKDTVLKPKKDKDSYSIIDEPIKTHVLTSLETLCDIVWENDYGCVKEDDKVIGSIFDNVGYETTQFYGDTLIEKVKILEYDYWQQDFSMGY